MEIMSCGNFYHTLLYRFRPKISANLHTKYCLAKLFAVYATGPLQLKCKDYPVYYPQVSCNFPSHSPVSRISRIQRPVLSSSLRPKLKLCRNTFCQPVCCMVGYPLKEFSCQNKVVLKQIPPNPIMKAMIVMAVVT